MVLVGDAVHLNSPMGGFGMNSGIHDAVNAAEKLSQVLRSGADGAQQLALYERQRMTVTRDFVRTCQTPVLILPDDIPAHPYAVAMEAAMLAPNAEVSMRRAPVSSLGIIQTVLPSPAASCGRKRGCFASPSIGKSRLVGNRY